MKKCVLILLLGLIMFLGSLKAQNYSISGYVKYNNKDSTVLSSKTPNTSLTVYLKNNSDVVLDSINTDSLGFYKFIKLDNGTYKLTCKTRKLWGGANPVDALLVARSYIELYNITDPLKKAAGDVDNDSRLTPIDALMINRRYIGIINKFYLENWLFSNPTIIISGKDVIKNIQGNCAGDVNSSYGPPM
jgi:hypothetical protein